MFVTILYILYTTLSYSRIFLIFIVMFDAAVTPDHSPGGSVECYLTLPCFIAASESGLICRSWGGAALYKPYLHKYDAVDA